MTYDADERAREICGEPVYLADRERLREIATELRAAHAAGDAAIQNG